ncbi:MAG: type II secretion system F family protein [Caldilineaceae bacterium]
MDGILYGLLLGLGIFLIFYGYDLQKQADELDPLVAARLPAESAQTPKAKATLRQGLLARAKNLAVWLSNELDWLPQPLNLQQKLAWAGERDKTLADLRGDQILNVFGAMLVGFLIGQLRDNSGLGLALVIIGVGVGVYLPIYELNRKAKQRQEEITLSLPDGVDLISTAVIAGLGLDRAITYAAEHISGPLGEEFQTYLHEMSLGMPRQDAYQRLIWRNSSDEMQVIVGALLQGQSLGAPVSETLEAQAEAMRERRLQRAKEAGAKATPRISLVMIACIVPAIFLMFAAIMFNSIYQDSASFLNVFGG